MISAGLRNGILSAVFVVFYFALVYAFNKSWFLHPGFQWGALLIYLLFMYRAAKEDAHRLGDQRDFRQMVRTPFLVFICTTTAYWLFYYALHLADKSLIVMELDAQISALNQALNTGVGDPDAANFARKQIVELEQLKAQPAQPLGPVLAQLAQGALGGFGMAALITVLVRKS
ncbi:MAG: hypothetical protein KGS48_06150 [Bacteroidetes bacterium]|nr:hypothetical protein [Bacteroidota bacterium]